MADLWASGCANIRKGLRMLDHALLRERFEALLDRERHVEGMYASMASESADPSRRELAEMLHRDKRRHIQLAERLLEIVV